MYYLKIRDDDDDNKGGNSLIYYCRNCGHENTTLTSENVCVSETQLRRSEQKFTHMVNEYTKYDPTLPRINTIKCPNQECISNSQTGGAPKKTTAATKKPVIKIKSKTTKKSTKAAAAEQEQEQATATNVETDAIEEEEQAENLAEESMISTPTNNREVIYIRYDDINMKYVYLCVHCDTTWKTDNRM
jgi:hypothetical protein